jgi:hypothetical protein
LRHNRGLPQIATICFGKAGQLTNVTKKLFKPQAFGPVTTENSAINSQSLTRNLQIFQPGKSKLKNCR